MQLSQGPTRVGSGVNVRHASRVSVRPFVSRRPQVNAAVAEKIDWAAEAAVLDSKSPLAAMDHALAHFGTDVGIAFSGAEDVALIEYAKLTGRPFRVFSLDTGRLNAETYRLFDAVEKHYGIHIEYTFPDAKETMDLVRTKGLFSFYTDGHNECCKIRKVSSFYTDGHNECCKIRKVLPLRRQLKTLKAWITGQRKDQSPGTRMAVPVVQVDPAFEGVDGGAGSLIKYNPLSNVTSAEVWNFLRVQGVPVNELHAQGYVSIGCEPCTRPVLPNQHEREGRWWWEDATAKECGLHSGNIKKADGTTEARVAERDLWVDSHVATLSKEQAHALAEGKAEQDTLVVLYAPWCPFCQGMEASYADLAAQMQGTSVKVAKYQADIDKEFCTEKLGLKTFPTIILVPKGRQGFIKYPSERRDAETLKMWVKTFVGSAAL